MIRRALCLLLVSIPIAFFGVDAQVKRGRGDASPRPRPVSAETRAAVRSVMEAHQRIRQQPTELQEIAIELDQARHLLPNVMGAPREELNELRDRTLRMRALLRVVKWKAPTQREYSGLAEFEKRCERLFSKLDEIVEAKSKEERTRKAGALYRELALAEPHDPNPTPDEPTMLSDPLGPGDRATREGR